MCPADYSRADCGDCLAGAASSVDGLQSRCPGSTTVLAMFERCLIRYSNVNFFGTPEKGIVYSFSSQALTTSTPGLYGPLVAQSLKDRSAEAMVSPHRFSASAGDPYTFVQCTWDLPADKCRECLDDLSDDASNVHAVKMEGQRKSFSCTVRYSNTSFMVMPFTVPSSGPPPQSVGQTGTFAPSSSASGSRAIAVVGAVVAVVVVACLVALLLYVLRRRRRQRKLPNTEDIQQVQVNSASDSQQVPANAVSGNIGHDGKFTYQQLADATRNFSDEEKLGEGSFGAVHRGRLAMVGGEKIVAVKTIMNTTSQRVRKDFYNEIEVMRPVGHRNIISLLGSCDEGENLLLVYELMENGDLEEKLYPEDTTIDAQVYRATDPGTPFLLDWHSRRNILMGVASGLVYLHSECRQCVLHRDIKPSNIMLDKKLNAKLCDFGLVTQVRHTKTSRLTNTVCGTLVYMDPEYLGTGMLCEQSDVYSFGIVLLEVVCGERPRLTGNKNSLVEKVRSCHQRNAILEAADRRLLGKFDDKIEQVLRLGLFCVHADPKQRLPIIDVKEYLRKMNVPLHSPSSSDDNGNSTEYRSCLRNLPSTSSQLDDDIGTSSLLPERRV
ncbi:hypothetical protein QYE76_025756 [Lolium multiflorum]|uniref:Uncharacterized protein n=1 Tax=Lolium multiflorum TaxID=4521 RepID=A0AAD8VUX5_LOLMU|nr:hypothetical protein QYE76_025756 [Lolium multiflorum]